MKTTEPTIVTESADTRLGSVLIPSAKGEQQVNNQALAVCFLQAAGRLDRALRKQRLVVTDPDVITVTITLTTAFSPDA